MAPDALLIMDGPLGSELALRGVPTPLPTWSAGALRSHPDVIRDIHRSYAEAGAHIHTANTFRTQPRWCPEDWEELTQLAVRLAREAVGSADARIAGSLSPLEDCYRPDLSPTDSREEHRLMARALADAGVDLILVETFPHIGEALIALEEACATGKPAWFSLTAGPAANLLTPEEMRPAFAAAAAIGASALLVNCIPARAILGYLPALSGHGLPFGAYANAGGIDEGMGWQSPGQEDPKAAERYAELARSWIDADASILGSCCGTGPDHISALKALIQGL